MSSWWNDLQAVSVFNTWAEVIALFAAAITFISILYLWRNGTKMATYLIDREQRASKRIKNVEKAAEQIRKELLTTQQNQDIVDQRRRLAEMDSGALRKELEQLRKRYTDAEVALKSRIKELKDINITQGATQGSATTKNLETKKNNLDIQQQKMLIKLLKSGPKGELDIISDLEDPDSHQTALGLKKIFDDQGWATSDIIQSAFSKPPEGVVLAIHSKQTAPSYAKFLQRTLTTIGLPVSAEINSKFREWSMSMIVGKIDSA